MTKHDYITRAEFHQDMRDLESRMTNQFETALQQNSAHYSDVLKSNQELTRSVADLKDTVGDLVKAIEPVIEGQQVVAGLVKFTKWFVLPVAGAVTFFHWLFKGS